MTYSVVAVAVMLIGSTFFSFQADAKVSKAERKAASCFGCHGKTGISPNPMYPSLAGQSKNYLVKQLKAFKSGDRKDPVMGPMARILSDEDINLVSAYFAETKPGKKGKKGKKRKRIGDAEMSYEGSPSGIDPSSLSKTGNPFTLSKSKMAKANKVYFQRCAGCHGVLRKGATGKPLTTDH